MKNVSRRTFLKQLGVVGATGLLSFGKGLAFAQSLCQTQKKVLVVIHLNGGVHSLSVLPPRQLQSYYDKHPMIGINDPLVLNPAIGLHPAMSNLHNIYSGGFPGLGAVFFNQVGFLNSQGQDVNSRSHEVATQQYASALTNPYGNITSGWLGRYAARHCYGDSAAYSLVNLSGIGSTLKEAGIYPVSAGRISDMIYTNDSPPGGIQGATSLSANEHIRQSIQQINAAAQMHDNEHQQLFKITHEKADSAVEVLAQVRNAYSAPADGTYLAGNPLNQRFMDAAALINSWNLTKVSLIAMSQGGYDTHAGQGTSSLVNGNYVGLARNLYQLDQAIGGFYRDLQNRNILENVVVLITSEFGRTFANNNLDAQGNPSFGTDHGTGGACIVIGSNVRRSIGYCNYYDGLFTANNRNWIKADIDIRSIYAEVLERHLGVASNPIFPEAYVRSNIPIFT